MMPVNDAFPAGTADPARRRYQKETGRRISFEYSMVQRRQRQQMRWPKSWRTLSKAWAHT